MEALKKYPGKLMKRKHAAEKKPVLKMEKRIKNAQEHTISGHAVLLFKHFM